MIRINLLPAAKRQARTATGSSQSWIIGYLVAAGLTFAVLAFLYVGSQRELEGQQAQNDALNRQITQLESDSADIEMVRSELERSRQLESVVNQLQRARYGPTSVLMEISRVLSTNGGPTVDPQRLEEIRRENPLAGYSTTWDTRRLWITEFREDNRQCTVRGTGKTNEDVAEFLRRLTLSEKFENIVLVKTEGATDSETDLEVISFELTCAVVY